MTDTIEHGRLQAAESLAADIASFDFGTNTGSALEVAEVTSNRQLLEEFPDIARQVFPTDPRTGKVLSLDDINISLSLNRAVKSVDPLSIVTDTFQSAIVNERENTLEDPWTRHGPFSIEETITTTKQIPSLSNKQKAGILGILGVVLIL